MTYESQDYTGNDTAITKPAFVYLLYGYDENDTDTRYDILYRFITFNLAGLQTAAVIIPNETIRYKVWRGMNTDEVAEPNVFAMTAAITAWTQGDAWLDALRSYLFQNRHTAAQYLQKQIPEVNLVPAKSTYLLWIDCHNITENAEELAEYIRRETGLYLCAGTEYGKSGEGFLRMNIACRRETMMEGLQRLKEGFDLFIL